MISFAYTIGVLKLIRVEIQTGDLENLTPTQRLLLIVLASFANNVRYSTQPLRCRNDSGKRHRLGDDS